MIFRILLFTSNNRTSRYSCGQFYSNFLLLLVCICAFKCVQSLERPFYNIAHMVNSIKEINYYLSRGANAIEADVSFSPNGTALQTFHGYPCDCFRHCNEREDLEKYLRYVRDITKPGESLGSPFSTLRPRTFDEVRHVGEASRSSCCIRQLFWAVSTDLQHDSVLSDLMWPSRGNLVYGRIKKDNEFDESLYRRTIGRPFRYKSIVHKAAWFERVQLKSLFSCKIIE